MHERASRSPDHRIGSPRARLALIRGTGTGANAVKVTCRAKHLVWIMQQSSTTRLGSFIQQAATRRTYGSWECKPPPRPGTSCGNFWTLPRYLRQLGLFSFPFPLFSAKLLIYLFNTCPFLVTRNDIF